MQRQGHKAFCPVSETFQWRKNGFQSFFVDSANLWQHRKENECITLFTLVCCCSTISILAVSVKIATKLV